MIYYATRRSRLVLLRINVASSQEDDDAKDDDADVIASSATTSTQLSVTVFPVTNISDDQSANYTATREQIVTIIFHARRKIKLF